jgi:hypothetical protein
VGSDQWPSTTERRQTAADELGLEAETIEVRAPTEFDRAFLAVKRQGAEALIVLSSPLFGSVSDQSRLARVGILLEMSNCYCHPGKAGGP